jgi:hypothetical protein
MAAIVQLCPSARDFILSIRCNKHSSPYVSTSYKSCFRIPASYHKTETSLWHVWIGDGCKKRLQYSDKWQTTLIYKANWRKGEWSTHKHNYLFQSSSEASAVTVHPAVSSSATIVHYSFSRFQELCWCSQTKTTENNPRLVIVMYQSCWYKIGRAHQWRMAIGVLTTAQSNDN